MSRADLRRRIKALEELQAPPRYLVARDEAEAQRLTAEDAVVVITGIDAGVGGDEKS